MPNLFRSSTQLNKTTSGDQAIRESFDYSRLTPEVVQEVQTAAQRIRALARQTV